MFDLPVATHYDRLLGEKTIRITQHFQDPITILSPVVTGYKHVGLLLRVGVGAGEYLHTIAGYIKYITDQAGPVFEAMASTSGRLCYGVRVANSVTLGAVQQAVANIMNMRASQATSHLDNSASIAK